MGELRMTDMGKRIRHAKRMRDIIRTAWKYGFHKTIKKMGLHRLASFSDMRIEGDGTDAVRMRKMLEELGPSWVKMGQILSMRPDLIPREFIDEFSKLYDRAEPFPYQEAKLVVERELGKPLSKVFKSFEKEPMAAASIGQVHRARLKDGSSVVVKVQRPGIHDKVKTDMEILFYFADLAEKNIPALRNIKAVEIVGELDRMLAREMDYTLELKNTQRMYRNFEDNDHVKIPRAFPDFSTSRVLVLERIEGVHPTLREVKKKGWDPKSIADHFVRAMLEQYFIHGFFHADPSPGNLLIPSPEKVAFLDFGAMGDLTESRREVLMDMLTGFATRDAEMVTDSLIGMGEVSRGFQRKDLIKEVEELMDCYFKKGASVYDLELTDKVMDMSRKYGIQLPADFTLLVRSLFQTESTARQLDPDFNLLGSAKPIIKKIAAQKINPRSQMAELVKVLHNYKILLRDFPKRMDRILTKAEAGELEVRMDITGTGILEKKMDSMVKRIELSVMFAAVFVTTALIYVATDDLSTPMFLILLALILLAWLLIQLTTSDK